jgi:hypothetical protein
MPADASYWWRVQAYDANGQVIGQSELRSIFFREGVKIPRRIKRTNDQ